MISMKLSKYLQIVKPTYINLKVTPDTSIRNYNSTNVAKSISHMYEGIMDRISKEEKHLIVKTQLKCSYLIDIYKEDVFFYFIIPVQHKTIVKEKIRDTWKKVSIEEVPEIKEFSQEALKYQMNYKKEDALSLAVNKSSNEPLNSLLGVIDIMQETDRIGIFYNFIPCSQFPWKKQYGDTIRKIKDSKPLDKEKFNKKYIAKVAIGGVLDFLDTIVEVLVEFTGGKSKKKVDNLSLLEVVADVLSNNKNLSANTKKKKEATVIDTQMLVISESIDKTRESNNALSICQSYKGIAEDDEGGNALIYKKVNNTFYINDLKVAGVDINKFSTEECQNLLQLPGRELLNQYKNINKIDVLESELPKELQEGYKRLGQHDYKNITTTAFFTKDKDYKNLCIVYVGPTRCGKTTALCNLAYDSIKNGECVVVLDWIENCGLSEDIKKYINKDNILEIDLSNFDDLQGMGYNELDIETKDPIEKYNNAKLKTNQLGYLINSINDDSDLKARMERYLDAASIITFISNGPIRDVFRVLQDHITRHKYIDRITKDQLEQLQDYILALEELDEWTKPTKDNPAKVVGTKESFIQGVLNRVNKLKKNTVLELMLKKDTKDNINLADEMQNNKAIFIKMPENRFGTAEERDIITTYWLTKIWLSLQMRAAKVTDRYKRNTVNIITDELNQLSSAQYFVGEKLSQCAKFGGKFIISTMYINELKIREKLRTANTSYILISGADKTNFKELKEEFEQQGFALEDLFNLKRHSSLNLIKYENGYWAGITKLPPPIKTV